MAIQTETNIISPLLLIIPEDKVSQHLKDHLATDRLLLSVHSVRELSGLVFQQEPKVIICHQSLLEGQQAQVLSAIKKQFNTSLILIIGPSRPIEMQITALKYGARGYFDETLGYDRLDDAMNIICKGEVWVERHVISGLIDEISDLPKITEEQQRALDSLSPKERQVAEQVSYGSTNKMIARTMNITERTVKAHLTTIFQKMEIADRLSLAIFFRDLR
jgi:DNA-binding NarL/FixJ family response regulator